MSATPPSPTPAPGLARHSRWGLGPRLLVASFVLFVAITATLAVLGRGIDRLSTTSRDTTEGIRLLAVGNALEKSFIDIETGQRGYFITRDERFLEPWEDGRAEVRRYGDRMRELARSDAEAREIGAIDDAIGAYVRTYSEPIVAQARQGATVADLAAELPAGKEQADDVRRRFAEFEAPRAEEIRRQDDAARDASDNARNLARVLWVALAALLVVIALYLARSIGRPIGRVRAGVEAVARGDFAVRVDGGGLPETQSLATSFNDMAAELQAQQRDLERQRVQIEEHAAALERSNADLEQFAYAAAHDLQEPLRTVASYTELLGRRYRGQLDDDADEFIQFAVDGATRMQSLIRDLLSYSRLNTRAEEAVPVPLADVLADVERSLTAVREETGARIVHDGLPVILGDRTQLELLLQNLVGNAIKFHGDEPPVVRVEQSAGEAGRVEVRVVDNGIGIGPDYRERVFRLFQRLNHRSKYDGTGIGLALCKRIVERHGGTIWIEEPPEGGTAFAFTLPVAPDEPTDHDVPSDEATGLASAAPRSDTP